jgi:hypothetical protein
MAKDKNGTTTDAAGGPANAPATATAPSLRQQLKLPDGVVLVRRVRGPDGINHLIGRVLLGCVYCVSTAVAATVTPGKREEYAEFEMVFPEDAPLVDAKRLKPSPMGEAEVSSAISEG